MQLYDITIAANTTRQLDAPGSYFYYYSGSAGGADSTITLRGLSSGLRLILKPGQAFRLPQGQKETAWVMTNYANTSTIIGSVLVGDGDVTDNRITGSVEVIDGGKNRTLANSAFMFPFARTSTVGNYPLLQLRNPVASGKNVFIKSMTVTLNAAGFVQMGFGGSDLGTANGVAVSKNISSGASSAIAGYWLDSATINPGNFLGFLRVAANTSFNMKFDEPIAMTPNTKLTICGSATNTDMGGFFEYIEENI